MHDASWFRSVGLKAEFFCVDSKPPQSHPISVALPVSSCVSVFLGKSYCVDRQGPDLGLATVMLSSLVRSPVVIFTAVTGATVGLVTVAGHLTFKITRAGVRRGVKGHLVSFSF